MAETAVALSWVGLVAYWLHARRFATPAATSEDLLQRASYSVLAALGTLFIFAGARQIPHPRAIKWLYLAAPVELRITGALLTIGGSVLALWARQTLGRNWSARVLIKKAHSLIDHGPYRWIRHPIYAGILVMMTGTVVTVGTTGSLPGLILVFAAAGMKINREEALLNQHFGSAHSCYSRKVKRLFPLIW
jgi:protein-S-isoprenylcysteine O-methyltransferase Ste14